jgi:hypothetical protein
VYPLPILDWGWRPLDGAPPRYVAEPGAVGAGYLDLDTPANAVTNYFQPGINTPLTDLARPNSLGFLHRGATAFQLRILGADRTDNAPGGFATLVWEPVYNNVTSTDWVRSSDLANGRWWSTRDIAGQPAGATDANFRTLRQIADANPGAFVTDYGVNVGRNTQAVQGDADDITYGCARWNFEPLPRGS